MGPVATYLELSKKLCRHYLVFYISLLYRYLSNGDKIKPPVPYIVEDIDEYKVEAIIVQK